METVWILQSLIFLILAPLWMGVIWKIKNYGRTKVWGGSIFRYYALWWDQRRTPFEETKNAPVGQYLMAPIVVTIYFLLGLLIPTFFLPNPDTSNLLDMFHGDLFLIVGMLAASFLMFMLFIDPRNPFTLKSLGRQALIHIFVEPVLLINIASLVLITNRTDLAEVFDALLTLLGKWNSSASEQDQIIRMIPALGIVLLSLWYSFLALCSRIPFDDFEDDAELTANERSNEFPVAGPDLVLIQLSYALKMAFLSALLIGLLLPQTLARRTDLIDLFFGLLFFIVKMAVFLAWLAFWETRRIKAAPSKSRESLVNSLIYGSIAFLYLVIPRLFQQTAQVEILLLPIVLAAFKIVLTILPFVMVLTALRMSSSTSIQNMVGWYKSQTFVLFVILALTGVRLLILSQTGRTISWQSSVFVLFLIPPFFLLISIDLLLRLATLNLSEEIPRIAPWLDRIRSGIVYLKSREAIYRTEEEWRGLGTSSLGQIYSISFDFGLLGISLIIAYQITSTGLLIIDSNTLAIAIALLLIGTFTIYNKDDNILSRCLGFLMMEHSLLFIASQTVENSSEQAVPVVVVLLYVSIPLTIFAWFLPTRRRIFGDIRMKRQPKLMR